MPGAIEVSEPPVPAAAFELFPDRWVAVSEGRVIADADSLEELEADERVDRSHTVVRIPSAAAKFF